MLARPRGAQAPADLHGRDLARRHALAVGAQPGEEAGRGAARSPARAVGGEEADLDLADELSAWRRRSGCGRARRARGAARRRVRARRAGPPAATRRTAGRPSRYRRRASVPWRRWGRRPRPVAGPRAPAAAARPRCAPARSRQRRWRAARRPPRSSDHGCAGGVAASTSSSAPTRAASRSRRRTLSSTAASLTRPSRTACDELVAPRPCRARHGEVQRGVAGALGRPRRVPVGHDDAVEAPLVLEHVAQQRALGHRRAVDAVVGGHDGPGARVGDDRLERRQVQLAQRALVDAGVEREALGLGVVGDEVLDRRADALGLQAAHVGGADARGEQRVLAEALEVPAAERRAVQVDRRRQQDVDALAPALGGQQAPEALDPPFVPRRRQGGRRRDVGRGLALVPAHAAHPGRAVGGDERAQPDVGLGVQRPEIGARQQAHLLLEAQRRQPFARNNARLVDRAHGPSMGPRLSRRRPAPASGSTRGSRPPPGVVSFNERPTVDLRDRRTDNRSGSRSRGRRGWRLRRPGRSTGRDVLRPELAEAQADARPVLHQLGRDEVPGTSTRLPDPGSTRPASAA